MDAGAFSFRGRLNTCMNYSIEVTEEPDALDLLEALKGHLNLNNGNAEDEQLTAFIGTAASLFELETGGRVVLATGFRQWFADWDSLALARDRVTEVTAVGYFDADDAEQELPAYADDATGWRSDLTGQPPFVYLPSDSPPTLTTLRPRPVFVDFTAGWDDADSLPDDVRVALLQLAAHLYANRESHTPDDLKELPAGFRRVCDKYQTGRTI